MSKQKISNWGGYPVVESEIIKMNHPGTFSGKRGDTIARGLGRSYGDSSLAETIVDVTGIDRFLAFDDETGVLRCEAGVSFATILEFFVPKGWFLPVTPGTKFITVGGAIASDVHGKNHHKEVCFGNWVSEMKILLASGETVLCSPTEKSDLFYATIGGMGLTGIILEAEFALKKIETSFIKQEALPAENLDTVMRLFDESKEFTYSVAWIDCLAKGKNLGKSILFRGEHANLIDIKDTPFANTPTFLSQQGDAWCAFQFPFGITKFPHNQVVQRFLLHDEQDERERNNSS
jgi:decaprenylphospho-beta-D-ribofuranose 2-oxidase